ncbi:adenylate cyclase [Salinisphaera sp. PC39]|uniref:CYTH domain-containing protein n=1 Tax=Salinisphaera sp. PC39 TaxID=1304156 RepID=UPI00334078D3
MAVEIERKFLVSGDGWREEADAGRVLRQGYLCGPGPASVRVRVDGERAELNIKAAVIGASRAEYEYPVPLADAEAMLAELCVYPPLSKTRYLVRRGGHVWEIDEFDGANAGLVVAEIELSDPDEAFERPPWLGREVTAERRYYNQALAERPYREWDDDA